MLEPGERIDNHDKECAEYYSALLEMGAYDEEFAFFGTAYIKQGRRKCYISTNRRKVFEFFYSCKDMMIYPTIVESKIRRLRVHSGEKSQVEQTLKLEFARELCAKYSFDFLKGLQTLALCPINNASIAILEPLKNSLEGCFDEDALALFQGAVDYAYEGKILTSHDYYRFKAWIQQESDFLTEKVYPACNLKREVSGFGYIDGNQYKYYTNALFEKVLGKRLEFMCKGKIVTPIYKKWYYLNSFSELPSCLNDFDQEIKTKVDSGYFNLIEDLYALKPDIDVELFKNFIETMGVNERLKETLKYYEMLWHVI